MRLLYYYKARFYSPALGRFLQTDPIGTQDDMNLYAYVGNNPVNFNNPSGMAAAQAKQLAGDLLGAVQNWLDVSKAGFQSSTLGEAAMKMLEGMNPAAGMAIGVGATKLGRTVSRIVDGSATAAQTAFKTTHYVSRLEAVGVNVARAEAAVATEVNAMRGSFATNADVVGRLTVDGVQVEYRARLLPNGMVNVGTLFPVR